MSNQSSPSRVAGKAFRVFEHAGQKYLLSEPLRVSTYADEEAIVLWKRRDPGEFAIRMVRMLPASYHAGIWEGATAANMRGIPSEEEWAAYGKSQWKSAFMFWNTLDERHKKNAQTGEVVSLLDGVNWAMEFMTALPEAALAELHMKIQLVSQEAALKNSSGRQGPSPLPAEPTEQQTEGPDTPDTRQSTSGSPSGLDTPQSRPTDSPST